MEEHLYGRIYVFSSQWSDDVVSSLRSQNDYYYKSENTSIAIERQESQTKITVNRNREILTYFLVEGDLIKVTRGMILFLEKTKIND